MSSCLLILGLICKEIREFTTYTVRTKTQCFLQFLNECVSGKKNLCDKKVYQTGYPTTSFTWFATASPLAAAAAAAPFSPATAVAAPVPSSASGALAKDAASSRRYHAHASSLQALDIKLLLANTNSSPTADLHQQIGVPLESIGLST